MGYRQNSKSKHEFEFLLTDVFGGGWQKKIYEIIAIYIYPEMIENKVIKAGWHNSHTEIVFKKFNIIYSVIFDEFDTITIISDDDKCTMEVIEHWAKIIDEHIQLSER
jgi:hypothetical protein